MFFKRKMDVDDYCAASLKALFSTDRESVWEQLRQVCNDPALSSIERTTYFNHMRAIMITLTLIAITKNSTMGVGSDARFFVLIYTKDHDLSHIEDLASTYNGVFGSTPQDGIAGIIASFSDQVTDGRLRQDTMQRLQVEFYAVMKSLFDEFKSIKLTTKRG